MWSDLREKVIVIKSENVMAFNVNFIRIFKDQLNIYHWRRLDKIFVQDHNFGLFWGQQQIRFFLVFIYSEILLIWSYMIHYLFLSKLPKWAISITLYLGSYEYYYKFNPKFQLIQYIRAQYPKGTESQKALGCTFEQN